MLSFADTLAILPQQLVFGLTLGTAYGLIAIGYTMVYGVLFMINFAHGDVFMIGAYIGWALLGVLFASHVVPLNPFIVLPLLLVAAMVVTGVIGLLLERLAYRPLYQRGATRLGLLISAVGASIFLQNAVMLIAGAREKVYMSYAIFPRSWRFSVAGVNVSVLVLVIAGIALGMMLALNWLVQRHLARSLDPRGCRGPRDGGGHGHRRVARRRVDLLHRVGARRCRGRAGWLLLYAGRLLHGLFGWFEGVHRGGAGWHRQRARRDAGRIGPRRRGKPGGHLHQSSIQGRDSLRGSDPGADVPSGWAPG